MPKLIPLRELTFTVPLACISVNHYKGPAGTRPDRTTGKLRPTYKLTPEALAYKAAVAIFAAGRTLAPESLADRERIRYGVRLLVVLGKGQRLDADNAPKVVLDGLEDAGVIHSDARIKLLTVEMVDDERTNPRTEITVWVCD